MLLNVFGNNESCNKANKSGPVTRRKRIQQNSFKKENSSGTYHLQIEKVQDTCRCI